MLLRWWFNQGTRLAGAPRVSGLTVTRDEWRQAAEGIAAGGGRLLALWASQDRDGGNLIRAAFAAESEVLVLTLALSASDAWYPGIEQVFPRRIACSAPCSICRDCARLLWTRGHGCAMRHGARIFTRWLIAKCTCRQSG